MSTYAERCASTSKKQLEANLANHMSLVASDRWLKLDAGLRAELEERANIIRAALAPVVEEPKEPPVAEHPFEPFEYAERN